MVILLTTMVILLTATTSGGPSPTHPVWGGVLPPHRGTLLGGVRHVEVGYMSPASWPTTGGLTGLQERYYWLLEQSLYHFWPHSSLSLVVPQRGRSGCHLLADGATVWIKSCFYKAVQIKTLWKPPPLGCLCNTCHIHKNTLQVKVLSTMLYEYGYVVSCFIHKVVDLSCPVHTCTSGVEWLVCLYVSLTSKHEISDKVRPDVNFGGLR